MQSLDIFTNNDCLNSSFLLQKKAHCGATRAFQNHFTQNLKFIYADTSAASAEFLMSGSLSKKSPCMANLFGNFCLSLLLECVSRYGHIQQDDSYVK